MTPRPRNPDHPLCYNPPRMERIHQHQLPNGLWLLAEPVAGAQSLAMSLAMPAGLAHQDAHRQGEAVLLEEMICRGAGELDARAHSDALDLLGVQRDTSCGHTHLRIEATMIGAKLHQALPLLADMALRPRLEEQSLTPSRELALAALDSLDDEPQQKTFIEVRDRHYPPPFNRSSYGLRDHLRDITIEQVRDYRSRTFVPGASAIGFAGRFDWEALKDQVQAIFGDWQGALGEPQETARPRRGYGHVPADSTQVHIGLAYDAVPEPHPASVLQHAAVAVLSGGMSGRLFTEVREKRGLCYSVGARYANDRRRGAVLCYAGTTTQRAQETLEVVRHELEKLAQGAKRDEFERAVVGMKSRLVMQGESTGARASAIVSDQIILGRPRTLEELAAEVDRITLEQLNDFLAANPPGEMTIVTIGPSELKVG